MWEWDSEVMQEAIFIHDSVMRQLMPEHCGVEVMTEGDAFIIAFHDEHDAIMYCLHAQVSNFFILLQCMSSPRAAVLQVPGGGQSPQPAVPGAHLPTSTDAEQA